MQNLWTMVRWSLERRGLAGSVRACWPMLRRRFEKAATLPAHPFDILHGTDTGGLISGGRLATGSVNDAHITAYAGIAPSRFAGAMEGWLEQVGGHALQGYTFIDVGCGKGRAVLLASEYRFRKY